MPVSDRHVKGSCAYVKSCGRSQQVFDPFHSSVSTSLKVRGAVDVVYDVSHRYSSRERRAGTPSLRRDKVAREAFPGKRRRDVQPDCCSYDVISSFRHVGSHGKLSLKIGGRGARSQCCSAPGSPTANTAVCASATPTPHPPRPSTAEPHPTHSAWDSSGQTRSVANRHVHSFSLARSLGRSCNPSGVFAGERGGGSVSPTTDYASTAAAPTPKPRRGSRGEKRGKKLAPWDISQDAASAMPAASRGSGKISKTARRTLSRYEWMACSFPSASEDVREMVDAEALLQSKHVPAVSMRHASGRERHDPTKKDNRAALERILKQVNCDQYLRDKKAKRPREAVESSFGGRASRGTDMWLGGCRMDMAVQGVTEAATQPAKVATWLRSEANSILRKRLGGRAGDRAGSRAASSLGGGGGDARGGDGGSPAGGGADAMEGASFAVNLRAEQRKAEVERMAEQEYEASLQAVGFHSVQSPQGGGSAVGDQRGAAEEVALP